jgi:hypothetical protein
MSKRYFAVAFHCVRYHASTISGGEHGGCSAISAHVFGGAAICRHITRCGYVTHISSRMGGGTASGPGLPAAETVIVLRLLLAGGSNAEASQECI